MKADDEPVDAMAGLLLELAPGETVRAIEALAATLVNRQMHCDRSGVAPLPGDCGLAEHPAPWTGENGASAAICRRIARRAIGGSLHDPTAGATAFHHIDVTPEWAQGRYPVALFGSFLFYRL